MAIIRPVRPQKDGPSVFSNVLTTCLRVLQHIASSVFVILCVVLVIMLLVVDGSQEGEADSISSGLDSVHATGPTRRPNKSANASPHRFRHVKDGDYMDPRLQQPTIKSMITGMFGWGDGSAQEKQFPGKGRSVGGTMVRLDSKKRMERRELHGGSAALRSLQDSNSNVVILRLEVGSWYPQHATNPMDLPAAVEASEGRPVPWVLPSSSPWVPLLPASWPTLQVEATDPPATLPNRLKHSKHKSIVFLSSPSHLAALHLALLDSQRRVFAVWVGDTELPWVQASAQQMCDAINCMCVMSPRPMEVVNGRVNVVPWACGHGSSSLECRHDCIGCVQREMWHKAIDNALAAPAYVVSN